MAKSKIEKAMGIVERFEGRIPSRAIKDKIMSQCDMSSESASTYYYKCREELADMTKGKKRR